MKAQGYRMQKISGGLRGGDSAGFFLSLIVLAMCLLQNASADEGPNPSWFQRHFGRVTWEQAVRHSQSAKDICGFANDHLRYDKDAGDVWSDASEIWSRRTADCEDYAIVIMDMCREAGIEAWVELYFPRGRGEGHAVAVGQLDDGRFWISSFGKYETAFSREEISKLMGAMLSCNADDLRMGMSRYFSLRFSSSQMSRPVLPGSITSRTTRSGHMFLMASSPSFPFS